MNEVKKNALWLSLFGFALGLGVGLSFYYLEGSAGFLFQAENRTALALYLLLCGVHGTVNMGTSAVYGIEEWSILRCTMTHFLISISSNILFFGIMILNKWMDMPPAGVCAIIAAAFVAVYFLIWLIQYLLYKHQVKKMNAKLREWKKQQ